MVCDGPDPPENAPQDLTPPPMYNLLMEGPHAENEESDEEDTDYTGYTPLPQGPTGPNMTVNVIREEELDIREEQQSSDENMAATDTVPPIEPMDRELTREVWSAPRPNDPIQMDSERAQQVMSAMANFVLPPTSIPQWAQCVSEDQWKQTLSDRLEKLNNK